MNGPALRLLVARVALATMGLAYAAASRVTRRAVMRLTGVAAAVGGLALMGFGTIGSPLTSRALASGGQAITTISEACSLGVTTGTLTVSGAVSGNTVTLEVFAHIPGDSVWHPTGATETITMVGGTSSYSYSISGVPASFSDGTVSGDSGNDAADPDAAGDDYNAWRVQVSGVTGTFDGTTTKSDSYECSAATTTSTTSSTTSSGGTTSTTSTTSKTTSTAPGSTTTTSTASSPTTSTTTSTASSPTTSTTTSTATSPTTTTTTTTVTSPATSTTTSVSSSTATSTKTATTSQTVTTTKTVTAPGSSTSSSSSSTSSGTPASTSTTSVSTGVGAATITPSTGADAEFGLGLGLLLAGGGLTAAATRFGRRPKS